MEVPWARNKWWEAELKGCLGVQDVEIVNVLIVQSNILQACQLDSKQMLSVERSWQYKHAGRQGGSALG